MTGMRLLATVAVLVLAAGCTGDVAKSDEPAVPQPSEATDEPTEKPPELVACPRAESQATTLVQGWKRVAATNGEPRGVKQAEDFGADVTEVSDLIGPDCRGDTELGGLQVQADLVAEQASEGPVSRAVMVATATTGNAWLAAIKVKDQRFGP